MLTRLLSGLVGAGIIGCVVHSSVMASGGYATDRAPMLIGLAAGLIVGSAVVGVCWHGRRIALGLLIGCAILAGEGYTLIQTAERTIAQRDGKQAPIVAAEHERTAAAARVRRAADAKEVADRAVLAKASEKTCVANCRALLQQQVADAKRELDAARDAYAALPAVGSPSPLADRLGVDAWKVDLAAAALISIAANGLGAFLIAFAAHGTRPERVRHVTSVNISRPEPTEVFVETDKTRDALAEALAFAKAKFKPAPEGKVALRDIRGAYHEWCAARGDAPLPDREIGASLNQLFARVGLGRDGGNVVGIEWNKAITQTKAA